METGWGQEEKEKRTGMDECRQRLKAIILEKLDFSRETTDEEIKEMIDALIISESKKQLIGLPERNRLRQELFYAIRKLDILQELIDDSGVTEIMVNGTDGIFIERACERIRHGFCIKGKTGGCDTADRRRLQPHRERSVAHCGCQAGKRFPCQCGAGAGGVERTDSNHPQVSGTSDRDEGADGNGFPDGRSGGIPFLSGARKVQHIYKRRHRFRQNHVPKRSFLLYSAG